MAGKLSFSIAINLLTENFKRGTNNVKNGLRSMQMQVLTFAAALGAGGIGLSNFVSRLIDVARETGRATTALKNVSGTLSAYANNQKYVIDLAKKYGLEVNALTSNFAKFTAAASISGMTMLNQRKVFESVSRASTAFGLSADESNGVMLALSQMMSKGKISSEELRLQMGERLPVALQAMAKAAGVSVAGLDKLLKQGKLMSADILPKFAEALNEMIPNVDTDNIETSVNRLKNTFTEFTSSLGVQNKYKAFIDWLTGALSGLKNSVAGVVAFTISIVSGKLLMSLLSYFGQLWKVIDSTVARAKAAEEKKLLAAQSRIEAEKVYEKTLTNFNTVENGKQLASKKELAKAQKAVDSARVAEKKIMLASQTADEKAAAVASTTVWGKAAVAIKLAWAGVRASLISLWAAIWPMALIAAIGAAIAKIVEMRKEAQRVKNIFSDYQKNLLSSADTSEVTRMQTLLKIMNDRKKSQTEINAAQSELQKMIGKEKLSQEELNKQVKTRIALLKGAAMAEAAFSTVGEYTEKNAKLATGVGLSSEQMERLAKLYTIKDSDKKNRDYYYQTIGQVYRSNGVKGSYSASAVDKALEETLQNNRVIDDAINRAGKYQPKPAGPKSPTDPDDDKKKETPLQKEQKSWDKQYAELGAELEIGKITQAEYNKALGELNIKMYAQAKGTGDKEVIESKYFEGLKEAAEKAIKNQDKSAALVEFEKVQKDFNNKVKESQALEKKGLISKRTLNTNISDLSLEAAKSVASIKGIGNSADRFIGAMILQANMLKAPITARMKKRDTTYDYKKNASDIAEENYNLAKDYAGELKTQLSDKIGDMMDELNRAMDDADFAEALKIAEAIDGTEKLRDAIKQVDTSSKKLTFETLKKDVKDLKKEINESLYSGIKDIASSSDRVVSAFRNLNEVMSDVDSSGWERIMAVWNAITNTVDSFLSIIKTIETITELTNKLTNASVRLSDAKKAEALTDTVTTTTKISNAAAGSAATIAATAVEQASATTEVAANTAKGASSAGASAAKLPFPMNIIAIGGAIAAAVAAFALIPKFAGGGVITGGPTSGDKILARVNAGEMILNKGQQTNLFNALDSGNFGRSGNSNVTIGFDRVLGSDIYLSLKNYMKSTGKKL